MVKGYPDITDDMVVEIPIEIQSMDGYESRCKDDSYLEWYLPGEKTKTKLCRVKDIKKWYYGDTLPIKEIAPMIGISPQILSNLMEEHGIRKYARNFWRARQGSARKGCIKIERLNHEGYMKISSVDKDGNHRRVFEHRVVMEQLLGRKLHKGDAIHHIDFNKENNDVSNLWVCDYKEHGKIHWSGIKILTQLMKLGLVKFSGDGYVLDYTKLSDELVLREKYPTSKI